MSAQWIDSDRTHSELHRQDFLVLLIPFFSEWNKKKSLWVKSRNDNFKWGRKRDQCDRLHCDNEDYDDNVAKPGLLLQDLVSLDERCWLGVTSGSFSHHGAHTSPKLCLTLFDIWKSLSLCPSAWTLITASVESTSGSCALLSLLLLVQPPFTLCGNTDLIPGLWFPNSSFWVFIVIRQPSPPPPPLHYFVKHNNVCAFNYLSKLHLAEINILT